MYIFLQARGTVRQGCAAPLTCAAAAHLFATAAHARHRVCAYGTGTWRTWSRQESASAAFVFLSIRRRSGVRQINQAKWRERIWRKINHNEVWMERDGE